MVVRAVIFTGGGTLWPDHTAAGGLIAARAPLQPARAGLAWHRLVPDDRAKPDANGGHPVALP